MAAAGQVAHRGGRPPKPPESRLSEVVRFRETTAQVDAYCVGAIRAGLSVNEFIRQLARRGLAAISVGAKPANPSHSEAAGLLSRAEDE